MQPILVSANPPKRQVSSRVVVAVWLGILAGISLFLGLYQLDRNPYVLDELWTVEITQGRGSLHQHLPLNQIISTPPFYSLDNALPWWNLWTHMEITHPPLYAILLRWWEDAFGDGDLSGRIFSVTAAVVAVVVLFDVVRLQAGLQCAVCAGLILAVACPQVEYSRITRGYTMLTAVTLLAADAMMRIQLLGMSRRRIAGFTLALFATAFTHYFAAGTLLALLGYAWIKIPNHRRSILAAYGLVGLVFAVVWGPFMWQQRHLFSTADPAIEFLTDPGQSSHSQTTAFRCLLAPINLLFPVGVSFTPIAAVLGSLFYLLPIWSFRKHPFALLWWLWLVGTVAVVAALDFARGTNHLYFMRYILLAGPAVYAMVPLLIAPLGRHAMNAVSLVVVIACAAHLPGVYAPNPADPRLLGRGLITPPSSQDLVVVAVSPDQLFQAQGDLLRLTRYISPMNSPVALMTQQASPEFLSIARNRRFVFLLARGEGPATDFRHYLPDEPVVDVKNYPGLGRMWTLQVRH